MRYYSAGFIVLKRVAWQLEDMPGRVPSDELLPDTLTSESQFVRMMHQLQQSAQLPRCHHGVSLSVNVPPKSADVMPSLIGSADVYPCYQID